MFALVSDSTSDLPLATLHDMGVHIAPLNVTFGEETYLDAIELSAEAFYEKLELFAPDVPKSSCPTPGAFERAYREALATGADGIVCITIGGGVSGTYNASLVAAETCSRELGVPICCVDSNALSGVMAMLLEEACDMRDAGMGAQQAAEQLRERAGGADLLICMESIDLIVKGGRVSQEEAESGGLAYKPICTIGRQSGVVEIVATPRGHKAQYRECAAYIERYVAQHPGARVRFNESNAAEHIGKIRALLDERGIAHDTSRTDWVGSLEGVYFGNHCYVVSMLPAKA